MAVSGNIPSTDENRKFSENEGIPAPIGGDFSKGIGLVLVSYEDFKTAFMAKDINGSLHSPQDRSFYGQFYIVH